MQFKSLILTCKCGAPAARLDEVGFSADHHLVVTWRCPLCKRHAYSAMPLSDCWKLGPFGRETAGPGREPTVEDEKFLRSLGVSYPH